MHIHLSIHSFIIYPYIHSAAFSILIYSSFSLFISVIYSFHRSIVLSFIFYTCSSFPLFIIPYSIFHIFISLFLFSHSFSSCIIHHDILISHKFHQKWIVFLAYCPVLPPKVFMCTVQLALEG